MSQWRTIVENILSEKNIDLHEEDKDSIEYARQQVEAWKERIRIKEISDDSYYTYGTYENDKRQLSSWESKLEELERASHTPEENAKIDAEKRAKLDAGLKQAKERHKEAEEELKKEQEEARKELHYEVGDKFFDTQKKEEWIITNRTEQYDPREKKFYYKYYLEGYGPNPNDKYGFKRHMVSGNFPLHNKKLFAPIDDVNELE